MDEMLRYIFKSLRIYDGNFATVARFFETQNKINALVAANSVLFCIMHHMANAETRKLSARVAELEREKNQDKGA